MCDGKIDIPEKYRKFRQFSCVLFTRTMYLLSATGFSNLPKVSSLLGACSPLSIMKTQVATTSSATTGCPSDQRAFGLIRNRYVILSGETCQCVARTGKYASVVGWMPRSDS